MNSSSDGRDENEMAVMDDDEKDDVDGNGPASPSSFELSSPSNSLVVITEASTSPAAATTTSFISSSHNDISTIRHNMRQLEKMQRRVPPTLDLHYITSQIIAMAPPRAAISFYGNSGTNEDDGIRRPQSDDRHDNIRMQKRRKQKGNDLNEIAMFLERRHLRRYLLFNVSDDNDDGLDDSLRRQVVHLPWGSPSPMTIIRTKQGADVRRSPVTSSLSSVNLAGGGGGNKSSGTPSVSRVMDICYALHAYLSIPPRELPQALFDGTSSWKPQKKQQEKKRKCDGRHHHHHHHHLPSRTVACIYCGNGKTRTGVTIACYLRFCNSVPNSLNGFEIFCERRGIISSSSSLQTQAEKDISSHIPPSLRQFFRNFDEVVNMRRFPHPEPLLLRSIQLQGVPVDDMPCVDIWEHGDVLRRRIYSSHEDNGANDDCRNYNTSQLNKWDDEEGSYTVGKLLLRQDFMLVCRFGGEFAGDANDPSKVLFRYVNNPNFLREGESLELNMADVDMMRRYADSFDDEDFLLTLVFESANVSIVVDDNDNDENGTSSCPERGCWRGRHSLSSTGLAKFDGVIQHKERDVVLQGWRVLSDAHSSRVSSSEREYELLCIDLESSIFKLVCPGEHEIDFRSIALQFTNGDVDSAKAELIGGLFQDLFSSVSIQRPIVESPKQPPLDVAPPLDDISISVVGTVENDQSCFTTNVAVAVVQVSPLEVGNSREDKKNGSLPLVEKQQNNEQYESVIVKPEGVETCVPLVLTGESREDNPSNSVGLKVQYKMVVQSEPIELKEKFRESSEAENDVGSTNIECGDNQPGKFVGVTDTKEIARNGHDASQQSFQRFRIPDRAAQTGNEDDYVGMRSIMQSGLRFVAAEHKPTTEIDHTIQSEITPLEFLLPEQSTVGEVTETSAIVKNVYQSKNVHSRNDESSTKNIDHTGTPSGHYVDHFIFTRETSTDQLQSSFLEPINRKSISTVSGNDNWASLSVKKTNIESYSEASIEDFANQLLSPLLKDGTAMTDRKRIDPATGVCETPILDLEKDLVIIEEIDCSSTISDNRVLNIGIDHSAFTGNDYETFNTFRGVLSDDANDGPVELSKISNVQRRVERPQTIPQNRTTHGQGECTAIEDSAMVVNSVCNCGDGRSPYVDELEIIVGNDTADAGLHQLSSVVDYAQKDKSDDVDHRAQITGLLDLNMVKKAGDGSEVSNATFTAGTALRRRISAADPGYEKYYHILKMVRSCDLYIAHAP
jgi:hypothetical protein